jgi:hypothetical protein
MKRLTSWLATLATIAAPIVVFVAAAAPKLRY